jgi:hydrogenase maturation protein HypF
LPPSRPDRVRKGIEVIGIVQGVGFRPHVYRLAEGRGLKGNIANTAVGVAIEVEGPGDEVEDFLARLPLEAPPLARILETQVRELPCQEESVFRILPSRDAGQREALIVSDVAVCDHCLRELFDPHDRRFEYPFINCTHCGPRYTIVRDIPYDRPQTAMAAFPLCGDCQREYEAVQDRRFHAQAIACPTCGPQIEILDRDGERVPTSDPIAAAVEQLRSGAVVAVKGLGGFHLAVNATDAAAVARLRERKRRVEKPFAVMLPDLETIEEFCAVDPVSREVLRGPERPILLLRRRPSISVAEEVAPFNCYLGVLLPYTPLHHLLFRRGGFRALVMTSGNLSEEPIAIGNDEAVRRLRDLADSFLVHNRDILVRCDDSVCRVAAGRPRQVRRARGYVPAPLLLGEEVPPILAVGGELKNTVCLTRGRFAFVSHHIGDLENAETYAFFEQTIDHLRQLLGVDPCIVAYDLHPDYLSTRWARAQTDVERVGVQHHHAHIAACMAEHRLEGRVIGFALDGTGYGTDGRIWGGEVLTADYAGFERVAHLAYVSMPGGAAAIREPWRMAVSYLVEHFGEAFLDLPLDFVKRLDRRRTEVLLRMIERGIHSPLTSSCGRLFDAVSALVGIRHEVNYEAQAAIELEMAGEAGPGEAYPLDLLPAGEGWQIQTGPLFTALTRDLRDGVPVGEVSSRFHRGLVKILGRVAGLVRERRGLNRVCLSGGSFQNLHLFEGLRTLLEAEGFEVFTHAEVPCGDGGLSLGQALVAAHAGGGPAQRSIGSANNRGGRGTRIR